MPPAPAPAPADAAESGLLAQVASGAELDALRTAVAGAQSQVLFLVRQCAAGGRGGRLALAAGELDAFSRVCLLQRLALLAAGDVGAERAPLREAEVAAVFALVAATAQAMASRQDAAAPDVAQHLPAIAATCAEALRAAQLRAQQAGSADVARAAGAALARVAPLAGAPQ